MGRAHARHDSAPHCGGGGHGSITWWQHHMVTAPHGGAPHSGVHSLEEVRIERLKERRPLPKLLMLSSSVAGTAGGEGRGGVQAQAHWPARGLI